MIVKLLGIRINSSGETANSSGKKTKLLGGSADHSDVCEKILIIADFSCMKDKFGKDER